MALTLAEAHRMMQAAIAKAEDLHVKLTPYGRPRALARRTPSSRRCILDTQWCLLRLL